MRVLLLVFCFLVLGLLASANGQCACPSGTCCESSEPGKVLCCPYTNGKCCSDKKNCCPPGYECDVHFSRCIRSFSAEKVCYLI